MDKKIFREASLERLSSPEQLDQLIKVTSPRAWLALIAIGLILSSIVVWGFYGSIPTKIEGPGILLNNGGVYSLEHHASGQVINVRFEPGDRVKKGDVIARIELPELVEKINALQDAKQEMENKRRGGSDYVTMEKQIEQLQDELIYQSQIVSPIEGRILDLNIKKGSVIQPGETIVVMEQDDHTVRLEAVVYVSAVLGGVIKPGMEAQVSPTIVHKEEYGYMLGRVVAVSDYPATPQSMIHTLGNENLVSLLAGQGVPLKVQIDLIPDESTKSGYKWSSPGGPPMSIPSGTLVNSVLVVKREKPIGKVIPLLGEAAH